MSLVANRESGLQRTHPVSKLGNRLIRRLAALIFAALLVACDSAPPGASAVLQSPASLRVITSGGFAAAFDILRPMFEAETGIDITVSYGSSSGGAPDSIPVRLQSGEYFDVLIMSRPALDRLTVQDVVYASSMTDLVKSTIGMAVKSGAPNQTSALNRHS